MADLKKIGAKITLEGEKEYKQALKNITSEQRVLKSEMKLADAQFKATGGSIESMERKSKVLTEQISSQKEKVDVLKEALEKSKEQYGENSDQANSWQVQLNNAEAELTSLNSALANNDDALKEAQRGAEDAGNAMEDFNKGLSDTESTSRGWGSTLLQNLSFTDIVNLGKTAFSTISSAAKAVYQTVRESATYADDVLTTAMQKGIEASDVQTFNYMAELVDTPAETIETAMTKITTAMYNAKNGSEKYVKAFEKIGVQYKNDDGTLRDANDVFWDTVDALADIENKAERDGLAMELFGKKASELTGVINLGKSGFEEYKDEAEKVGYTLSTTQLEALSNADDAFVRLDNAITGLKNQIGAVFAPAVTSVINGITSVVTFASNAVKGYWSEFDTTLGQINEKIEATRKQLEGTEETYQNVVDDIDANVESISALADIIYDLGTKTDLTETEERRLQGALAAINKLIPGLNLEYDKQAGTLSKTREEVDKLTQAYKTQALEQALTARSTGIAKAYGEAIIAKVDAEKLLTNAIAEHGDTLYSAYRKVFESEELAHISDPYEKAEQVMEILTRQMTDAYEQTQEMAQLSWEFGTDEVLEAAHAFSEAEMSVADAKAQVTECEEAIETFNKDADEARRQLGIAVDDIDASAEATDEAADAMDYFADEMEEAEEELTQLEKEIKAYADATGASADEIKANFDRIADAYAEAYKSAESSITGQTGLFNELTGESEVTAEKMLSNLLGQNQVLEKWSTDIQALIAAGLDQGIVQQLINAGPSAAQAVHDMAIQVTDENNTFIHDLNNAYRDQLDIKTAFAETMAEAETGFNEYAQSLGLSSEVIADELSERGVTAGAAYGEGVLNGLASASADDSAEEILAKADETAEAYKEAGATAASNYTSGINEELEKSKTEVDTQLEVIKGKFETAKSDVGTYGEDMAFEFLANAIDFLEDEVNLKEVQGAIDKVTALFDDTVTYIGDAGTDSGEGFMDNLSGQLVDAEKKKTLETNLDEIVRTANLRITPMMTSGKNMANGIVDGFIRKLNERQGEISASVAAITTTVNAAMDSHSPSRVMMESGGWIGEGLIQGTLDAITGGLPDIAAKMDDLAGTITGNSALYGLTMADPSPAPVTPYQQTDLSGIRVDIAALASAILDRPIVLNDGVLVGHMADKMDAQMGRTVGYRARRI